MCGFMAGAISTGRLVAHTVVLSRSSEIPLAIFPRKLAVAGAITNRSAQSARLTCRVETNSCGGNRSVQTGFRDTVSSVNGVMKWVADSVMITCTSAPAFPSARTRYGTL